MSAVVSPNPLLKRLVSQAGIPNSSQMAAACSKKGPLYPDCIPSVRSPVPKKTEVVQCGRNFVLC